MTDKENVFACYMVKVSGIVQGVGFRPFVYNLAVSMGLNGWVINEGASVVIEIEGKRQALDSFVTKLRSEAPLLSRIKDISVSEKPLTGYTVFQIKESSKGTTKNIYISPDVSVCEDCRRELFDPADRRFMYPFINCTNCGPRFTIIKAVPYDRINTTMSKFQMCGKCSAEYNLPSDRRYHAQPVSCYDCGPKLELIDNTGKKIEDGNIIERTASLLAEGKIVAIKGLGGYHLACDALNRDAVSELRRRKIRDDKPFALMVRDYESALKLCCISEAEKKLLECERRPIVLLRKRDDINLPDEIAPGNPNLGIMLPYTPVHLLLFQRSDTLVMTSGNLSSEPIYYKDSEAIENLKDIADYFLTNDREIYIRTDDSVTRVFREKEYIIRRSRGYVPMPVTCELNMDINYSVLACGGELKNTFCLNKGNEFYLSHHIGDLENAETLASFEEGIEHFKQMFNIKAEVAAHDLHPEYLSTKYALDLDITDKIPIQHHHAHIASVMAENSLDGDVIGVAFDGTGYGEDGNIWGGEFFVGNYSGFKRMGHLNYVKMPGGDRAIKEPWRMAVSYLTGYVENMAGKTGRKDGIELEGLKIIEDIGKEQINAVIQMMDRNINSPLTSSMGRLFDAVAALTGVRSKINYEGQAAIELEYIADRNYCGEYTYNILEQNGIFTICVDDIFKSIIIDMKNNTPSSVISSKFHETIANIVLEMCRILSGRSGLRNVAMSGGVFQNLTLLEKCVSKLEDNGFATYIHSKVPSNDGGIALGQAVMALAGLKK